MYHNINYDGNIKKRENSFVQNNTNSFLKVCSIRKHSTVKFFFPHLYLYRYQLTQKLH